MCDNSNNLEDTSPTRSWKRSLAYLSMGESKSGLLQATDKQTDDIKTSFVQKKIFLNCSFRQFICPLQKKMKLVLCFVTIYRPFLENGSYQLILILYTLSIYSSITTSWSEPFSRRILYQIKHKCLQMSMFLVFAFSNINFVFIIILIVRMYV